MTEAKLKIHRPTNSSKHLYKRLLLHCQKSKKCTVPKQSTLDLALKHEIKCH